jgi:hypothetical protein
MVEFIVQQNCNGNIHEKLTDKQKEMIKAQSEGYLASEEFNKELLEIVKNEKVE